MAAVYLDTQSSLRIKKCRERVGIHARMLRQRGRRKIRLTAEPGAQQLGLWEARS
jgi:hypothetical protein